MKYLVYAVMFLLLDPVRRTFGVAVSAVYLVVLLIVGAWLLFGPKSRPEKGSQGRTSCGVARAPMRSAGPVHGGVQPGYPAPTWALGDDDRNGVRW